MKQLILLLPALLDQPQKSLGGKTPLEVAQTTTLDEIASCGEVLKVYPSKGGCEQTVLDILNLNREQASVSRSSLMAYGLDLDLKPPKSVFRFQFVSLIDQKIISGAQDLLTQSELELFCLELNEAFGDWIFFAPLEKGEGIALLKESIKLDTKEISLESSLNKPWLKSLPTYFQSPLNRKRLQALREFLETHKINELKREFQEHEVNGLFFYDAGAPLNAVTSSNFYKNHLLFASSLPMQGVAKLLGINIYDYSIPKINKFEHIETFLECVQTHLGAQKVVIAEFEDLLVSTLKGALLEKIKRIELFDLRLLKPLLVLSKNEGFEIIIACVKNGHIDQKKLTDEKTAILRYKPHQRRGLLEILSFKESEINKKKDLSSFKSLSLI